VTTSNVGPDPARPQVVSSPWRRVDPLAAGVAIVACGFGLAVIGFAYRGPARVFPAAAAFAVLLLLLTLCVGYLVLRRIRPVHPPPHPASLACVAWGMTAATGCAILANSGLGGIWAKTRGVDFADRWGAAATAPFDEETLKVCGVLVLALLAGRAIRGPVDGWAYGALVGLGFQVVENLLYALDAIVADGATDPASSVAASFAVRVGLTAWGSHWAMSAVAGAGVGFLLARDGTPLARRVVLALALWGLAMALHWFFDSPFLPGVGGILLKVAVDLVVALAVYRAVRRRYVARFRAVAAEEAATDAVRPSEAVSLPRRGTRRQVRRGPFARHERALIHALQDLQLALVEGRIPHADPDEPAHSQRLRAEIAALRAHLPRESDPWPAASEPPAGPAPLPRVHTFSREQRS